jgi:hypothetical protein
MSNARAADIEVDRARALIARSRWPELTQINAQAAERRRHCMMSRWPPRALITETLPARQLRLAYPLMREALPGLTLKVWMAYARRLPSQGRRGRGILVARREGLPQLLGAVHYERGRDLQLGVVLRSEHFVALDLLHPQDIVVALIAGLESVAKDLQCDAIRLVVQQRFAAMAQGFGGGQQADGLVLTRLVAPRGP